MKRLGWLAGVLLLIYSASLLLVELRTSQDFVRNFFTDIEGDYPFYAINTTVSVFFLWAAALLFLVCLNMRLRHSEPNADRRMLFYASQVAVLAFLGVDDRFLLHEELGKRFGFEDALIIGGVGVIELVCLFALGHVMSMDRSRKIALVCAAAFTGATVLIDALAPSEAVLRLSCEDLAKTWGAAALFLFAWLSMVHELDALRPAAQGQ